MKIKIILFVTFLVSSSAANAQKEMLIFPNDEECKEIVKNVYESGGEQKFTELTEHSVSGMKNSVFRYIAGRDSIVLDLKSSFGETQLYKILEDTRKKLDADQIDYLSAHVSYNDKILAKKRSKFSSENPKLITVVRQFSVCVAATLYKDEKVDSSTYKSISKFSPRFGRFGYFDITVENCGISSSVGTKNKYSEPSKWEGSQFVVLDARFRNVDKEGRLPSEGSLIIKTPNGDELRYDNTESIMSEGYGIYFKSVNPLVTMPTKIVYRIPTDIEGEILWEPGRNDEGKRLWCAFVSPEN